MCYIKASFQFDRPETVTAPAPAPVSTPSVPAPASISSGTPVYVLCFLPCVECRVYSCCYFCIWKDRTLQLA